MNRKFNSSLPAVLFLIVLLIVFPDKTFAQNNKADMVDMFMGVQGNSNCVIGPQLPHGSINPSPQTLKGKHGGYVPGQPIRGFGQLHVSGTGWGRYGQIFISPQVGFNPAEDGHDSPVSAEKATPYYYSALLDRYKIKAEVSPTAHCAIYRFTFFNKSDNHVLLDIAHNIPQHIAPEIGGKFLGGNITYDDSTRTISGWGEYMGGFGSAKPYKVFFAIKLDATPARLQITDKGKTALFADVSLPNTVSVLNLRVGISFRNVENARNFLGKEIAGGSLEEIADRAKAIWEKTLGSIKVTGGNSTDQRLFYTTLYHSFVMPRDRTGDAPADWPISTTYIDDHYCVWDTWRTKYPLMVLLQESFVAKTINSFVERYAHNGVCNPTFTSGLDWEEKQGGDDVDNVITDAFVKNVKGFNRTKAYKLIKDHALHTRSNDYLRLGWLPDTGGKMSCSYNVEYAYNDYCVAQVASLMGDLTTSRALLKRSTSWEKLFDPSLTSRGFTGFIAPRLENGNRIKIDPAQVYGSWVKYFYEGNSWVYSLFVPHQFNRLIELCGGKTQMVNRLTYGFDNKLIDLSNEPGFLGPFIYSYCDRPDLTFKYVIQIRHNNFSLEKGYPDNEDSGAMGSWYVFTSIGLFPNAGQNIYYLLPPAFPSIELKMENGKKIRIKTVRRNPADSVIKSVWLNGKRLKKLMIRHQDIADGANITFNLTSK
ncbi:MAG: glycoside hydrolase family 92 protein [Pedobacter sp.]|nr:MAG: glycoside hydrolase family 92 protein [Pedobacter sp.]